MKRAILADDSPSPQARTGDRNSKSLAVAILNQAFDVPLCLPD